jgi:hypothetical protein
MKTLTPELDKQHKIIESGASDTLTEFYDWLSERGWLLARWEANGKWNEYLEPVYTRPEQLFAEFFGIDLDKIESERRAVLEELRSQWPATN